MTRPNFEAVIYPSTPDDLTVPADAPPLFLVHADDDRMRPPLDHAVRLYAAWKKVGRGGYGRYLQNSWKPLPCGRGSETER